MTDHATFFIQRNAGWFGWDVVQRSTLDGRVYPAAGPFWSKRTAHWVSLAMTTTMRSAAEVACREVQIDWTNAESRLAAKIHDLRQQLDIALRILSRSEDQDAIEAVGCGCILRHIRREYRDLVAASPFSPASPDEQTGGLR